MVEYQDLKNDPRAVKLVPIVATKVASLRARYPQVPSAYFDFLLAVGAGEVGSASFQIYGGPLMPEDIYDDETAMRLKGVVLFGDDFQGYCYGFSVDSAGVVEIDPNTGEALPTGQEFAIFVRDHVLHDAN